MGKGSANPVEQWRKKEKKKLQKKHTEDKIKARSALLMQKEPDRILADIRRIQWAERQGIADPKMLAQKKRLLEIHKTVSEKKQAELERREKEKSVVVKGLTKFLGRSVAKPSSSGDSNRIDQELQELQELPPPADEDGILAAPPNLAPPRTPGPVPWAQPPPPTHIWQPYGPPLPYPGSHHHPMPPSRPHPATPAFIPPTPKPILPSADASAVTMESAPAVRTSQLSTEFIPTNMLLHTRRRQAAAAAPAKRRKPAENVRPAPEASTMESAESAYNSFLSEIGE